MGWWVTVRWVTNCSCAFNLLGPLIFNLLRHTYFFIPIFQNPFFVKSKLLWIHNFFESQIFFGPTVSFIQNFTKERCHAKFLEGHLNELGLLIGQTNQAASLTKLLDLFWPISRPSSFKCPSRKFACHLSFVKEVFQSEDWKWQK